MLTRGANGRFAFAGERSFDAWGVVRAGASSGVPNQRYCASLGHVQDDETGLVYMRARYYEPGSGRFVSEDPARDGANWFSYCGSNPIAYTDGTGRYKWKRGWQGGFGQFCMSISFVLVMCSISLSAFGEKAAATTNIVAAATFAAAALSVVEDFGPEGSKTLLVAYRVLTSSQVLVGIAATLGIASGEAAKSGLAFAASAACLVYSVAILGVLICTFEPEQL